MAPRSPARWMAPLALLAAFAAVGVIVSSTTGGGDEASTGGPATATSTQREESSGSSTQRARTQAETTESSGSGPRTYTVESGDTFGSIAESTGLTVEELQELNPDLDPQSLNVGDRVRLRR